jgi:chromosomal replication initiator protein
METESAKRIWETALGELEVQVSKHNYQTWLEKTAGLGCRDNQFVVGVPNAFVAEYLDKNQRSLVERTLIRLTRRDIRVLFEVDSRESSSGNGHLRRGELSVSDHPGQHPFNPRYTFASFVTGSGNLLTYSAALEVARNPGKTYNPLFIYGGVGLGKTHLLHAIGHEAAASHLRVGYASCERFTNEFITALQEKQMESFRRRYRGVDMLMLDDIQFISGKEQTEECLFHTFNELHDGSRQIIVTSDRPPKSIPRLAERLRSRFEWGLVVDIKPPDLETRLAILQVKARESGADIPPDSLELIARKLQQNIRELEGNLNRVIAYARLLKARATPELAAEALKYTADGDDSAAETPAQIIEAVARSFQLNSADLAGLRRDQETALARQIAMYLIREQTGCPLAQIGLEFGKRNPSTVKHACEKIAAECSQNPHLRRRVSALKEQISSR